MTSDPQPTFRYYYRVYAICAESISEILDDCEDFGVRGVTSYWLVDDDGRDYIVLENQNWWDFNSVEQAESVLEYETEYWSFYESYEDDQLREIDERPEGEVNDDDSDS